MTHTHTHTSKQIPPVNDNHNIMAIYWSATFNRTRNVSSNAGSVVFECRFDTLAHRTMVRQGKREGKRINSLLPNQIRLLCVCEFAFVSMKFDERATFEAKVGAKKWTPEGMRTSHIRVTVMCLSLSLSQWLMGLVNNEAKGSTVDRMWRREK